MTTEPNAGKDFEQQLIEALERENEHPTPTKKPTTDQLDAKPVSSSQLMRHPIARRKQVTKRQPRTSDSQERGRYS